MLYMEAAIVNMIFPYQCRRDICMRPDCHGCETLEELEEYEDWVAEERAAHGLPEDESLSWEDERWL